MKKKMISILTSVLTVFVCAGFAACKDETPQYGWVDAGKDSQSAVGDMENYGIPPIIEVNSGNYSLSSAPIAVKGKKYNLFSASAKDIYGNELQVQTEVYANYYTETRSSVSIANNTFTPLNFGVYTVEYTAVDSFGNKASVVYDVHCQEKEEISAILGDAPTSGQVGDVIAIAPLTVTNTTGEVAISITAVSEKGYADYSIGEDMCFFPEYADVYKIVYTYSDYNEVGIMSYTIDVAENPNPIFKSEITLNNYYIVGCEYELPQPDCFYSQNGKYFDIIPSINITYQDGTLISSKNGKFTPEKEGTLTVAYTASFSNKQIVKQYQAKAVDVGYTGKMDMSGYFYGDGIQTETFNYGISIKAAQDTTFDFINPVASSEFSVKFGIDPSASQFNRFDIYLTDSADKDNIVKFSYVRNGAKGMFYVNDDDYSALSQGFLALETTELYYDNITKTATLGDSAALNISKNLRGEKFSGFKGDKVFVTFALAETNGYSGVYLYQIDNQVLSNEAGDGFRPFITFFRYDKGIHYVGDIIEVERIWACDVLDPDYTVEFSVKGPDGQYVKDIFGNTLNTDTDYTTSHSFQATMLGNYIVNIFVSDSCENEQRFSYAIIVTDGEAPVLRFGIGSTQCTLGETIAIKKATGYDNITEKLDIHVYVCTPLLNMIEVQSGAEYTPTQKGKYVVYAYAQDEHGNVGMTSYIFEVK
jgi:hypothetical protein